MSYTVSELEWVSHLLHDFGMLPTLPLIPSPWVEEWLQPLSLCFHPN